MKVLSVITDKKVVLQSIDLMYTSHANTLYNDDTTHSDAFSSFFLPAFFGTRANQYIPTAAKMLKIMKTHKIPKSRHTCEYELPICDRNTFVSS